MITDLTGKKYGRLTVIKRVANQGKRIMWLCKCDCGNEKAIGNDHLKRGEIVSCGCYIREKLIKMGKEKRKYNHYEFKEDCVIGYYKDAIFQIDKEDYEKIRKYRWRLSSHGYMCTDRGGKSLFLHKLILPSNKIVDHINGNVRDNRKSNLRECTQFENTKNHKVSIKSKSGYSGVVYREKIKRWTAIITYNYKQIHLGCFKTKEEAIEIRRKAEQKYFGGFARNVE